MVQNDDDDRIEQLDQESEQKPDLSQVDNGDKDDPRISTRPLNEQSDDKVSPHRSQNLFQSPTDAGGKDINDDSGMINLSLKDNQSPDTYTKQQEVAVGVPIMVENQKQFDDSTNNISKSCTTLYMFRWKR